jgi:hypothetical protein
MAERSSPAGVERGRLSRDGARPAPASDHRWVWALAAGALAGVSGVVLAQALRRGRALDPRLVRKFLRDRDVPPTIIVPGILGSSLVRPDGSRAWLDLGNAVGWHELGLPLHLPPADSRDDLLPGGLVGLDAVLPRLFGFTEYADLLALLHSAGFRALGDEPSSALGYVVATYDWRRDLVASARRLSDVLEALADARRDRQARFNVVAHSMGALVVRYYLRYGTAEPGGPVTWAGANRIRRLFLMVPPNSGSIAALDTVLNGSRVGLSYGTLAAEVVATMPAIYQLLPAPGTRTLLDERCAPLDVDLFDPAAWKRFRWGAFSQPAKEKVRRSRQQSLCAILARAREIHEALARTTKSPCPTRAVLLGGDCIPTLARAIVPDAPGRSPRFEPTTTDEADAMLEAGDARVTRACALAAHLPAAQTSPLGCGLPEVSEAFFGAAEHHGIYAEPTFQSLLLRLLLKPEPTASSRP